MPAAALSRSRALFLPWKLGIGLQEIIHRPMTSSSQSDKLGLLELPEVEKVLSDVKADDVKVIPVGNKCDWTDYMVIATGRSTWHVKNIAQALIYKAVASTSTNGHIQIVYLDSNTGGIPVWGLRYYSNGIMRFGSNLHLGLSVSSCMCCTLSVPALMKQSSS